MRIRHLVCLLVVSACSSPLAFVPLKKMIEPIPFGRLVTSNVTIEARDSSFRFESGSDVAIAHPMSVALSRNSDKRMPTTGWKQALDLGAKPVTVWRGTERFYGILALGQRAKNSKGPASASYRIDIPPSTFASARNGRIAYIGELATLGRLGSQWTWVLWLSDTPFAP